MDKVAIFVSDLHLGRGDELDDFLPANEFAFIRFLDQQSTTFLSWDVDLVVLGDFLDIWQVATDQEKNAPETKEINLLVLNGLETQRAQQIIDAHPGTFRALQLFLAAAPAQRRLVLVTGNHDHSLVDAQVQAVVRQAVAGGNAALASRVGFTHYYDAPELATYAEHGNQFDGNNDYDHFPRFGPESPGFFFVRLFWNRLESLEPKLDEWDWWNAFKAIWEDNLLYLVPPAVRFFRQYRQDPRSFERIDVPGVPFFAAPVPFPVRRLPEFPDVLVSDALRTDVIFSTDAATERRLRSLYHDPGHPEFKAAVDEILREKFSGQAPQVPEPEAAAPAFGLLSDEYVDAVTGMFAPPGQQPEVMPMKGAALNPGEYKYVLLGHTHAEKEVNIPDPGVTYINTGTWTAKRDAAGGNMSRLCFVMVQKPVGQEALAARYYWH
jgi:UDP-2,3-diacylglucosamine pyrophosphatase LpxH